jgi:hypothetical protein
MHHLNVRVAWHDNRWNGAVCLRPSANSFCVDLDRIRAERDDAKLDRHAGKWFAELAPADHPPCKAESGAFMNSREWVREFDHPYREIPKAQPTHGHLKPTFIKVLPFSTFAVPFNWMLRESQERLDESLAEDLPPDEPSPFPSAWVPLSSPMRSPSTKPRAANSAWSSSWSRSAAGSCRANSYTPPSPDHVSTLS